MKILFILLLFLSEKILAENLKVQVIFFGGSGFHQDDVAPWTKKLIESAPDNPEYEFEVLPFLSKQWSYEASVADGLIQIEAIAKKINANMDQKFLIVGHSSGSALAIEVAKKIKFPELTSVVLLDGFNPEIHGFPAKVDLTCWSASSSKNIKSKATNYKSMFACKRFREFSSLLCGDSESCLHFSLIDSTHPANTYNEIDFNKAVPNLEWLSP